MFILNPITNGVLNWTVVKDIVKNWPREKEDAGNYLLEEQNFNIDGTLISYTHTVRPSRIWGDDNPSIEYAASLRAKSLSRTELTLTPFLIAEDGIAKIDFQDSGVKKSIRLNNFGIPWLVTTDEDKTAVRVEIGADGIPHIFSAEFKGDKPVDNQTETDVKRALTSSGFYWKVLAQISLQRQAQAV